MKANKAGRTLTSRYGGYRYQKEFDRNLRVNLLVVRWAVFRLQLAIWAEKKYRSLHRNPVAVQTGNMLYLLGFWAEHTFMILWRKARVLWDFAADEFFYLLTALFVPLATAIRWMLTVLYQDFIGPLTQLFRGLHSIAEQVREEEDSAQRRVNTRKHLAKSAAGYWRVAKYGLAWVLPAAALVAFLAITDSMLGDTFILAVEVDGQTIGYVQNQQDFEGAKEDVNERIDAAKQALAASGSDVSDEEWDIDITYHLATESTRTGRMMSQNAMANAILTASSDQIQTGTAVYIDGNLTAVLSVEDNERFTRYLEQLLKVSQESESFKTLQSDPGLTNVRTEFEHTIENGENTTGVYFISSVTGFDAFLERLNDLDEEYVVQSWDTLWTIAEANGISVEELCELNGIEQTFEPVTGEAMKVGQRNSALAIMQKATITWQEDIPYTTVTEKNADMDYGVTKVVQDGQNGVEELVADIVYIEGEEQSRSLTNTYTLAEPVTEIVQKGTKLSSGMYAQYGSGNWVWPVPNYTYVSRWMSRGHNGSDICAPYGVDILACDSGVVTTAGWHGSYGNYIIIDHGNGWQTLYAHCSALTVSAGQPVTQGQVIGKVGSTGYSTGNHCHLEFRLNGSRVNAYNVFGGAPRK